MPDESHTTPDGNIYVCEELSARTLEMDELQNFEKEMAITVSENYCVRDIIHHYNRFPKTPATPFETNILDFYSTKDAYGKGLKVRESLR